MRFQKSQGPYKESEKATFLPKISDKIYILCTHFYPCVLVENRV